MYGLVARNASLLLLLATASFPQGVTGDNMSTAAAELVDGGAGPDTAPAPSVSGGSGSTAKVEAAKAAPAKHREWETIQGYMPSWLMLSVQTRGRFENAGGVGFTPGVSDAYYLSRMRFDLGIRPKPWLRFFAQGQDARTLEYNTSPAAASMYNPWDLRQAYVELGLPETGPVQVRFGRQEMPLGSGRLVSSPDWSNTGKMFDLVRLSLNGGGLKSDLFAGSPVLLDSARPDRHKAGEHLYGGYFGFKGPLKGMTVEPYLMARTQLHVAGERGEWGNSHLYTGGARAFGKLPGRFDYSAEVMQQWGYLASDNISAMAGAYSLGWTAVARGWKPRLSFDVSHASGDEANKDGSRNTFDQMYAGLHNVYGIADQSGERNIRQYKGGIEVTPSKKLKAFLDVRQLFLATTQDGFYNGGGTRLVLNRTATSTRVGTEMDLQGAYSLPHGLTVVVGFAKIFAGPFLEQSGKGDYSYPFVMWVKRF